jgi:hypothetical protein
MRVLSSSIESRNATTPVAAKSQMSARTGALSDIELLMESAGGRAATNRSSESRSARKRAVCATIESILGRTTLSQRTGCASRIASIMLRSSRAIRAFANVGIPVNANINPDRYIQNVVIWAAFSPVPGPMTAISSAGP